MSCRPDHEWIHEAAERFAFRYEAGEAKMEGVALADIAAGVGTPTYVYSAGFVQRRYMELVEALGQRRSLICYAIKANSSQAILSRLARLGAGADIVSGGELQRTLAAGFAPERIVFSGVGKTDDEIDFAIASGIRSINLESASELERVAARAKAAGKVAPVVLRVNPDVDPNTHPYLATGLRESKFGIAMGEALAVALQAAADPNVELEGLACHIGSQIADTAPYTDSLARIRTILDGLAERDVRVRSLDLGGGFGIAYREDDRELDVEAWGRAVTTAASDLDVELVFEPGRHLVGNAGVLLTRVIDNKAGETRRFIIIDGAMNDLIRPALYQAYHAVVPVQRPAKGAPVSEHDIVGPICESGDFIAQGREMPDAKPGDLLAVLSAGAYAMVMASTYNTRPLAPEVLVDGDRWAVTRRRQTVADLMDSEQAPPWDD